MKQCRGRTIVLLAFAWTVILIGPNSLRCQPKKSLTDQLSQEADVIVVGNVNHLASEWDATKSRIQTRVTIAVSDVIKGGAGSQSVTIVVPGGEVDGVGEWYSHTASFKKDEDVVVFAKKDPKGNFRIASGQMGKFTVKKDPASGRRIVPNIGSLDQFTSHIKSYLQSQQARLKQK